MDHDGWVEVVEELIDVVDDYIFVVFAAAFGLEHIPCSRNP